MQHCMRIRIEHEGRKSSDAIEENVIPEFCPQYPENAS
jgi:hypothetical protein